MQPNQRATDDLVLEVVKVRQNGHELFSTQLCPEVLRDYVQVDQWEHVGDTIQIAPDVQGYQRAEQRAHFVKIANYLANDKEAMMPTSALVSVRGDVTFTPFIENGNVGLLTIPKEALPMYAVDAQHRRKGLLHGIDELEQGHLKEFCLPAVIMAGVDKLTEVKQFYTINSTAKRIDTDLAERLLTEMADRDEGVRDDLIGKKKEWLLRGVKIADKINDLEGSPWFGRVQRPNKPKSGDVMVSESSLVASLKPVLSMAWVAGLPDDSTVKLIDHYWRAIMTFIPDANKFPREYAIQKTTGCYVMHLVAPIVFEACRSTSQKGVFTVERMAEILKPASEDYLTSDFWAKGGDAGTFSSSTGFQKLANRIQIIIQANLNTVTVDI